MYDKKLKEAYNCFESLLYEAVVDYLKDYDSIDVDIELEDDCEGCIADNIYLNDSDEPVVTLDTGELVLFRDLSPINKIHITDMM